jgi:nucleoside-diphosphate-sugar epimerase
VRTTVRSPSREADVRAILHNAGTPRQEALTVVAANLTRDAGWIEAVTGCRYVHHVASPFPATAPKNEDELIVPAREGTLRVLRAARDAGVSVWSSRPPSLPSATDTSRKPLHLTKHAGRMSMLWGDRLR